MADEQKQFTSEEGQAQQEVAQAESREEPQPKPQADKPAAAQAKAADPTDWKAEARKWEARAKENKAKADAYDEAKEAEKSELQRAVERADKAEARAKELEEERDHANAVKRAAAEYGVDEETLARMGGDVESNAAFLKSKAPARPAYPSVNDNGEVTPPRVTAEDIRGIKDEEARVIARANNLSLFR